MQGDGGSPSGIALMASAGIPSDAGSPQQGIHPGATLRHPPVQGASLQMTPQVSLLPSFCLRFASHRLGHKAHIFLV